MYTPYVRLGTTGSYLTQIDSALNANGAVNFSNPLGTLYAPPINEGNPTSTKGYGAPPVLKYVQYLSTINPAPVAFPAPVYWVDETYTVVSAEESESLLGSVDSLAGYLLVNTTSVSNLTAAVLTNSGNGVGVWIQIGGFLAGAAASTATAGEWLYGNATAWDVTVVANGTAPVHKPLGQVLTAAAAGVADVMVGGWNLFWGS